MNGVTWLSSNDGAAKRLVPDHTITNEFVGLSNAKPVAVYTFPHFRDTEYTFVEVECNEMQALVTERYLAGLDSPPHDHEFYEITIVRAGRAIHQTDLGDLPIETGTVMVVPPGQVHGYTKLNGFAITQLYYQSEWLARDLRALLEEDGLVPLFLAADLFNQPHLCRVHQFQLDEEPYTECIREIASMCRGLRRSSAHILYANLCFLKVLVVMSKAYCLGENSIHTLPFHAATLAVLETMEQSLISGTPFSFIEAANRVRLSSRYLSTMFRNDVGLRPTHFFQRRRAQHAAHMLVATHLSITELAHLLCYTDSSHFCNQFHKLYGMSPSDYRKRFRK